MADPGATARVDAIVLMGLMGSGKSTVGRILAARLGWTLDDSDASIEAREGRTVKELRDELGVDDMHALEARHLVEALAAPRPRIVTPAAFCIEVEACRAALRGPGVAVAYLRARPETLAARFFAQPHRPAYGDDPATFLAAQGARRDPLFSAAATVIVDEDDLTPDAIADRILEAPGAPAPR
ncbi:MAG: shikimate kinase [Chloroflexota bacterium]